MGDDDRRTVGRSDRTTGEVGHRLRGERPARAPGGVDDLDAGGVDSDARRQLGAGQRDRDGAVGSHPAGDRPARGEEDHLHAATR